MTAIESPTPIEELAKRLRLRLTECKIDIDRPAKQSGTWSLMVEYGGHRMTAQWKPGSPIGVSCSPEYTYGEGASEVYGNVESACSSIVSLLLERAFTGKHTPVRLREWKKERSDSQEGHAGALNARQAAISRIEQRNDIRVSALREVLSSMGGELRVSVRFPDGMIRLLEFNQSTPPGDRTETPNRIGHSFQDDTHFVR
jgi:hypothetical protein